MATLAQQLVEEYRQAIARNEDVWTWARAATRDLESLGHSTIGSEVGRQVHPIALFRCADGSRFAYHLETARHVWAMPDERLTP